MKDPSVGGKWKLYDEHQLHPPLRGEKADELHCGRSEKPNPRDLRVKALRGKRGQLDAERFFLAAEAGWAGEARVSPFLT